MKQNLFWIKSVAILFSILISFGCGGGGGGGDVPPTTAPTISSITAFKIVNGFPIESLSFDIGDMSNIEITASDPDLDMNTVFISQFLLPDLDSPFFPTSEQILPSQSDPNMKYFFIDPIEIVGPAGNWRMCIWIVDKAGNESNEFCVNVVVNATEEPLNSAPVAHAGPDQNVKTGSEVTLDGSTSSDADGDMLSYSWSFQSVPNGSSATLSNPSAEKPTFTADVNGTYLLNLVVNDGFVDSASDSVTITAQSLPALTYNWTMTLGSVVDDSGRSIALDSNNNIFVFGYFNETVDFDVSTSVDNKSEITGPNGDYFITKYNSDGSYGWTRVFASNDRYAGEKSITIDSGGNVYLTGTDVSRDMVVKKIDTNGNVVWEKNVLTDGYSVKGQAIDIDSIGNVYILGSFYGAVDFDPGVGIDSISSNGESDIFITKLNSDGSYGWTHTLGGASYDFGSSLSIDTNNNIYMTGRFRGTVDFNFDGGGDIFTPSGLDDIFVTKINSSGSYAWTKIFSSEGSDDDLRSITTDQNNNLYLTGAFYSATDFNPGFDADIRVPSGGDIFLSKINNDGSYGWTKTIDGAGYGSGVSVRVDSDNNIFLTGTFDGTVDFDPTIGGDYRTSLNASDIFIAQYSDGGNYLGSFTFGSNSLEGDIGSSVAVDSNNNIVLTGRFFNTVDFDPSISTDSKVSNGDSDIFIMRFDAQ